MHWIQSDPSLSYFSPVTGDPVFYTVFQLEVEDAIESALSEGLVEFWRRALVEGPEHWTSPDSGQPGVKRLRVEFSAEVGLFTAAYDSGDRWDEQGVFRLRAPWIGRSYDAQILGIKDIDESAAAIAAFERTYWAVAREALDAEPAATAYADAKRLHGVETYAVGYEGVEPVPFDWKG